MNKNGKTFIQDVRVYSSLYVVDEELKVLEDIRYKTELQYSIRVPFQNRFRAVAMILLEKLPGS